VVARVIVDVGNQRVEHHAAKELRRITLRLFHDAAQFFREQNVRPPVPHLRRLFGAKQRQRQVAIERHRETRIAAVEHTSIVRRHDPYASEKNTGDLKLPSSGVASFYTDTRTASGEKFNPEELTAAHPTLPFGTKLRVTNAVTGRSVTVRVNDRGPYVYGRVVDVTHSAAQALGMVGSGIAKVKLDVVE